MEASIELNETRQIGWAITCFKDEYPEYDPEYMRHYSGVREKCSKTGKLHWQIALWTKRCTFDYVRTRFPGDHIEQRRGTFEQNRVYCTVGKGNGDTTGIPGTEFEFGTRDKQGKRTDIDEDIAGLLECGWSGVSDRGIVKYSRGLESLRSKRFKPTQQEREVHWYHGLAGSDKSRDAFIRAGPDAFISPNKGGWLDNYDYQRTVIIDELDKGQFSTGELLRMCDRYPYQAPIKGGFVWWNATLVIITSHYPPEHYVESDRWPELRRRISYIHSYSGELVLPPQPLVTEIKKLPIYKVTSKP